MAQIGTIKVETAGGPVELPVYDLGDSGSNRVEAFRVQTASGPGFVPLTDVSAADRPYLRVQTGNGVKAFDTSASGIPDSGLLHHYDLQAQTITNGGSISSLVDRQGSKDLSGNATATTSGINSLDSADYDGTDDEHTDGTSLQPGSGDEYTLFMVLQWQTLSGPTNRAIQNGDGDGIAYYYYDTDDVFRYQHDGVTIQTFSPTTDPIILVASYDGSSLVVDRNGTEVINAAVGLGAVSGGVAIGSRIGSDYSDILLGEVGWYDTSKNGSERDEITNYAADRWNITV